MSIQAEAQLQSTKAIYAALAEEGKSELKNLEAFEASRRHQYEIRRAKVYEQLAVNQKNIVISGKSGDALINQIVSLSLDEKKKQ